YTFDVTAVQLKPLIDLQAIDKNIQVESSYYDKKAGKIWIGSTHSGLYAYNIQQGTVSHQKDSRLLYHPVVSIVEMGDKDILIGMEGGGMCLLDKNNLSIKEFYNESTLEESHVKSAVFDIYEDNEKRFWVSTFSD